MKAIEEFISILKEVHGDKIKKIILFGSIARGDADGESDVDVLIIGDISLDDVVDLTVKIMLKHGVFISPVIESEKEFEDKKNYSFYRTVMSEGVVIG